MGIVLGAKEVPLGNPRMPDASVKDAPRTQVVHMIEPPGERPKAPD